MVNGDIYVTEIPVFHLMIDAHIVEILLDRFKEQHDNLLISQFIHSFIDRSQKALPGCTENIL